MSLPTCFDEGVSLLVQHVVMTLLPARVHSLPGPGVYKTYLSYVMTLHTSTLTDLMQSRLAGHVTSAACAMFTATTKPLSC